MANQGQDTPKAANLPTECGLEEAQGRVLKLTRYLSTDLSVTDMLARSDGNSEKRREGAARQNIEAFDRMWARNSTGSGAK